MSLCRHLVHTRSTKELLSFAIYFEAIKTSLCGVGSIEIDKRMKVPVYHRNRVTFATLDL